MYKLLPITDGHSSVTSHTTYDVQGGSLADELREWTLQLETQKAVSASAQPCHSASYRTVQSHSEFRFNLEQIKEHGLARKCDTPFGQSKQLLKANRWYLRGQKIKEETFQSCKVTLPCNCQAGTIKTSEIVIKRPPDNFTKLKMQQTKEYLSDIWKNEETNSS